MKSRLEHDYTEVIGFSADRHDPKDAAIQGGATITLCAGRDDRIAFSAHGREWLGNQWGEHKCVKLEFGSCYHYSVQALAEFFERCAARLRQYKR